MAVRRSLSTTLALGLLWISILALLFAGTGVASHKPKHNPHGGGPPPPPPPPAAYDCALNDQARGPGAIVFSFDDTWRGQYAAGGVLGQRGICGTFYLVTGTIRDGAYYTDYMSAAEIRDLGARGHDLEAHSVTHRDLTTLTSSELNYELSASQQAVQQLSGKPAWHFAYPYAAYNARVQDATALYYKTGRTYTDDLGEWAGMSPLYPMALPALGVEADTTLAQAKSYVDYAKTHDATIVLVFHDLRDAPRAYDWPLASLAALADYAVQSGVNVRTVAQASDQGLISHN